MLRKSILWVFFGTILSTGICPRGHSCERWLIHQDVWQSDRKDYQVLPAMARSHGSEMTAAEFGRYARKVYTPQGHIDGTILAAANHLVTLAQSYLDFYGIAYESWIPLQGDGIRVRLLPGTQSVCNKAVKKIEERYGLRVYYSPAISYYAQKLVWVDEAKHALYIGHQNILDQLRVADLSLWHQLIKLEALRQHARGKNNTFVGNITVHGHGIDRFKELKADDDYFIFDWADVYATWRELHVVGTVLARGKNLVGTSSAEEEISLIQQKIDTLKTYDRFIELTFKNLLAPFLKWYWPKMWRLRHWRQALVNHNLNGLKVWPELDQDDIHNALASRIVLATESDFWGENRLWAVLSFVHEGKRWTTIRIPLNETALGPDFKHEQIERIRVVKTAVQQQAVRQLIQQMRMSLLLHKTMDFLNRPKLATDIYYDYHDARQELLHIADEVVEWSDPDLLDLAVSEGLP